jgi:hypothetical protein
MRRFVCLEIRPHCAYVTRLVEQSAARRADAPDGYTQDPTDFGIHVRQIRARAVEQRLAIRPARLRGLLGRRVLVEYAAPHDNLVAVVVERRRPYSIGSGPRSSRCSGRPSRCPARRRRPPG